MKDKAYRLGQAYAIGYQMAQDDWVTLENKEGEQYRVNLPGDNPNKKDESKKADKPKSDSRIDGISENTRSMINKLSSEDKEKAKEYIRQQKERFSTHPENLVRMNIETINKKIDAFARKYKGDDSDAKRRTEALMHSVKDVLQNRLDALVKEKHKDYPSLGSANQKYLRSPQRVVRETEKAVAIRKNWDGKTYTETSGGAIYKDDLLWLPKARTTIKDGVVYGTEPWIANKGRIAMDSVNALLEGF